MLIRHIPHSSQLIPADFRDQYLITQDQLDFQRLRLTDWYTDDLFADEDTDELIFPISRLVCDPERFLDDNQEPAAKVGMGVLYTHGTEGQLIRRPDLQLRHKLMKRFYEPHHQKLTEMIAENLCKSGRCLVLDCHSFPQDPLPTDNQNSGDRPDICLGFDSYHCPEILVAEIKQALSNEGFNVSLNTPYAGSMIPQDYFLKNKAVWGLMVELNRKIYMNEADGTKLGTYSDVKASIHKHVIQRIKDFMGAL